MPRHTHSHRKRKMWVENFPTLIFAAKYTVESGAHPRRRDDLNREERKNRYAAVAGLRVLSERKLVGCMRSDWGIRFFNFKPNNTRYTNRTYIRNLFSVFKHRYAITREDVYSKFFFSPSLCWRWSTHVLKVKARSDPGTRDRWKGIVLPYASMRTHLDKGKEQRKILKHSLQLRHSIQWIFGQGAAPIVRISRVAIQHSGNTTSIHGNYFKCC